MNKPLRAGCYARLSRLKDTPDKTKLAMLRQDEDTLALAAQRGYEVVKLYADPGKSASDKVIRDQFEAALADLADHTIDVLVIPRYDRLTRGPATWLRIERVLLESGGRIISVADGDLDPTSANGRKALRDKAATAAWELEMISERVTRWHRQRAYLGLPHVGGHRAFGYVDKQRSEVDEHEAEIIRSSAELLLAGESLRSVVAWVQQQGITAPGGKPWSVPNFRQMLVSPGVAGLRYYHGEEVATGEWTPVLDKPTWLKLRAKFDATLKQKGRPPMQLLSGLVRCGRCGQRMHSTKSPKGVRQYACRKRPGQQQCGRTVIYAQPVEALISEQLVDRLSRPGLAQALVNVGDGRAEVAAAELADAEQARDEIEQMFNRGAIKQDAFLRMHGPAEERVEAAHRAFRQVMGRSALTDKRKLLEDPRTWWFDDATTTEERREVLTAVLERVEIRPSSGGARRFDPDRVVVPREAWRV